MSEVVDGQRHLITDHRTHLLHILLEDGDAIVIDAQTKQINAAIDDEEMARRRERWQRPPSAVRRSP